MSPDDANAESPPEPGIFTEAESFLELVRTAAMLDLLEGKHGKEKALEVGNRATRRAMAKQIRKANGKGIARLRAIKAKK